MATNLKLPARLAHLVKLFPERLDMYPEEVFRGWASDKRSCGEFYEELLKFSDSLLAAMEELPDSPDRGEEVSAERQEELKDAFTPVGLSFGKFLRVSDILARINSQAKNRRIERIHYISYYFRDSDEVNELYLRFGRLKSWLRRRNPLFQRWADEYYQRPYVKARIKAARPSKEKERERKRAAYWKKKGKAAPAREGEQLAFGFLAAPPVYEPSDSDQRGTSHDPQKPDAQGVDHDSDAADDVSELGEAC